MKPTIHLAFVDDWEVRGNGSGDPRVLQFAPMRRLTNIYRKYGIRGSFNAEVMQQLTYRNLQGRFPELKAVAERYYVISKMLTRVVDEIVRARAN